MLSSDKSHTFYVLPKQSTGVHKTHHLPFTAGGDEGVVTGDGVLLLPLRTTLPPFSVPNETFAGRETGSADLRPAPEPRMAVFSFPFMI